ncbi:hypothetical protein BBK82_39930 [Lentzea guizhouensis]|uniref:Peptidase inhibitor n=1 Tax=Lentzea guizhouensis TaxID=1586287 RepID=A0A1B2HU14_9PSEU|nr:peptidase inhibitor family I36 protein [Lentzea guizhouensis]ANZ41229.1 hypothetical protein BBK82_39930 [Lentzea guizhouensis]
MGLLATALLVVAGIGGPAAQAAAPVAPAGIAAFDDQTGEALAAWDCNTGNVCFWTGFGGTGSRCAWNIADDDWTAGTHKCSWATTKNVKSVYNAGTSSATGVAYFKNTGHNTRVGCTKQGKKGDLAGTYQLRSHKWISTSCG